MIIQLLTLHTSKLQELKEFYCKLLKFPLIEELPSRFKIQIGESALQFIDGNNEQEPFYHFAFNIPANQFLEAKAWIKRKVPLLTEEGDDEIHFILSDAHSCYFEDPAGNIVELIARHKINHSSNGEFSANSIINISEIGLVVEDATEVGQKLEEVAIRARGDEKITNTSLSFMHTAKNGVYLLLVGEGRTWLFSNKTSTIFPLHIKLLNGIELAVDPLKQFSIVK